MKIREINNHNQSKKAIISREMYSDGYNYYICILQLNEEHNIYFINDNFKQKETILSYKKAIQYAKNILNL